MIKYPSGQPFVDTKKRAISSNSPKRIVSSGNRGMNLEDDINASNEWYKEHGICLITKRPTPINVVKVDYSRGAIITNAYFEKQSTTDYNGVYRGKYIDFEAKNTKSKTSFPLSNISSHQIEHLKNVLKHDGIAFFIVEFQTLSKVFLLDAKFVIDYFEHNPRKSIPLETFEKEGIIIKQGYSPRLFYIDAVIEKYFKL
ncbi:MAG: Holliday junction resolvase RecU [Bacilli bacterium]|nr:Holliday junction resolvase RecU [Bacilli bacterium]